MRILIFTFSLFISSFLFADGLPLDSNGNITLPHTIITLSQEQQTFLNNHRFLKLSEDQKILLGNKWKLDTLEVLDPHHHDCTCGQTYAIWINPKQIAILDRFVSQEPNEDFFQMCKENIQFYKSQKKNLIYISLEGNISYQEKPIKIEGVKTILNGKGLDFVLIFQPPKKENPNWNNILELKKEIQSINKSEVKIHWM
ncbi:hypothetical protein N9242_01990 [Vicingaceae bacterium]|nr:hypothetical protein [Vicingaceae bacterium]